MLNALTNVELELSRTRVRLKKKMEGRGGFFVCFK